MAVSESQNALLAETTCATLLQQLQEIWDEVGVTDEERDSMLLQIEQECLEVYKRKVEQAEISKSKLLQTLSDYKINLANLLSSLGETSLHGIIPNTPGTIKHQLSAISPALTRLTEMQQDRIKEFSSVQSQIQKLSREISGDETPDSIPAIDKSDLSVMKLNHYQALLQSLQNEKNERLNKVSELSTTLHDLCALLGESFSSTIESVHPSLAETTPFHCKSISNETLSRLTMSLYSLQNDKKQRLVKLRELSVQLNDLWDLMDTSDEERVKFRHVENGSLKLTLIEEMENEVQRLDKQKASRMKEIAFKKQEELEEIYGSVHVEVDADAAREKIMALIDSGHVEPSQLLADMDSQISKAKEEALSRKDILDKIEKWMAACEEESWLEDYNRDENRYSASRGAHVILKRAEKARVIVGKIPSLVEGMMVKTKAWEEERGVQFQYDGVPFLAMLDEYVMLRQEREDEKRRMRDQKKITEQQTTEQEAIFGTRSGTRTKRAVGQPGNVSSRRVSLTSANQIGNKSGKRESQSTRNSPFGKDDSTPFVSPVPVSPQ